MSVWLLMMNQSNESMDRSSVLKFLHADSNKINSGGMRFLCHVMTRDQSPFKSRWRDTGEKKRHWLSFYFSILLFGVKVLAAVTMKKKRGKEVFIILGRVRYICVLWVKCDKMLYDERNKITWCYSILEVMNFRVTWHCCVSDYFLITAHPDFFYFLFNVHVNISSV